MGLAVSTRVLKDRLSEYLRRAEAGERILVLRDGGAVAALVPVSDLPATDPSSSVAALAARGVVRLPLRDARIERGSSLPGVGPLASDMVSEDRR